MDLLVSILAFIIIFSVVVLIHEAGHFIMARRAGIKVHEFGMGLPPRLFGIKKNGVLWSINAIPFGGFVRMLGEDMSDKQAAKSKDSFVNKTLGQRIKVVVAGVVMNILLAYVLLTAGFIVGMEPLIVTGDDFLQEVRMGNVNYQSGIVLKDFKNPETASRYDLKPGDQIVSAQVVDGNNITEQLDMAQLVRDQDKVAGQVELLIYRNGLMQREVVNFENGELGLIFYPVVKIPGVKLFEVMPDSYAAKAGLLPGDMILKVNGQSVFSVDEYRYLLERSGEQVNYEILRENQIITIELPLMEKYRAVVTEVITSSPAQKAGLEAHDRIIAINDTSVFLPKEIQDITASMKGSKAVYTVLRNGLQLDFQIEVPAEGYIGIVLSQAIFPGNYDVSLYESGFTASILEIKDVRVPFYQAPIKVFGEMKRLAALTAVMFGDVLKNIVSTGTVPEGVAGPVGIARMTHTFVQEGFTSLIRFTALISLSLGVINILPLPALDGGRLFFLLAEGIIGRRLNPKWESRIHAIGFVLLLLLIAFVTINDFSKF